jgi:uncharacterized protein (DUF1697 family)
MISCFGMPTYIALLRGINVGGRNAVRMAALKAHIATWGAQNVRTYIQSGNVVFTHREAQSRVLQASLQRYLTAKLGWEVAVLVKSAKAFSAIARANPHPPTLPALGNHLYVCLFESAPTAKAVAQLQPYLADDERLVVKGNAGYAYYANGLGRAKLSSTVIERKLGAATLRNWNTVTALIALAADTPA